jgi:hypothetical protein
VKNERIEDRRNKDRRNKNNEKTRGERKTKYDTIHTYVLSNIAIASKRDSQEVVKDANGKRYHKGYHCKK